MVNFTCKNKWKKKGIFVLNEIYIKRWIEVRFNVTMWRLLPREITLWWKDKIYYQFISWHTVICYKWKFFDLVLFLVLNSFVWLYNIITTKLLIFVQKKIQQSTILISFKTWIESSFIYSTYLIDPLYSENVTNYN